MASDPKALTAREIVLKHRPAIWHVLNDGAISTGVCADCLDRWKAALSREPTDAEVARELAAAWRAVGFHAFPSNQAMEIVLQVNAARSRARGATDDRARLEADRGK